VQAGRNRDHQAFHLHERHRLPCDLLTFLAGLIHADYFITVDQEVVVKFLPFCRIECNGTRERGLAGDAGNSSVVGFGSALPTEHWWCAGTFTGNLKSRRYARKNSVAFEAA
jgi:hypothetical protein